MQFTSILATALAAAASTAPATPRAPLSSAYTRIDLDRCKLIYREAEGASATWRCPGLGKIPLFVKLGDERFDIDAGREGRDLIDSMAFDEVPSTVEWRLKLGVPFAIIYRLTVANLELPKTSRLLVETVGGPKAPLAASPISRAPRLSPMKRRAGPPTGSSPAIAPAFNQPATDSGPAYRGRRGCRRGLGQLIAAACRLPRPVSEISGEP